MSWNDIPEEIQLRRAGLGYAGRNTEECSALQWVVRKLQFCLRIMSLASRGSEALPCAWMALPSPLWPLVLAARASSYGKTRFLSLCLKVY